MSKTEDIVLKECLNYLQFKGIYCWRNNTGACKSGSHYVRFGKVGSADILGILPDGKFLAVECKREKGGVLSPAQKDFQESIIRNNGVSLVINDINILIDFIEKYLQNFS